MAKSTLKENRRKSDKPVIGIKIRLYPNLKQQVKLAQMFGNDRFLWNLLLDMLTERHKNNPKASLPSSYALDACLPLLSKEYPFLKKSDSSSMQLVTDKLIDAYQAFFDKTRNKPKRHKRKARQSYTGKSVVKILGNKSIKFPKLGKMKCSKIGVLPGKIKRYTISIDPAGRYWASLNVEKDYVFLPKTGKAIGIDMGLLNLAILSNGQKIDKFASDYCESQAESWQSKSSRRRHLASVKSKQDANKKVLGAKGLYDYQNWQRANQIKNCYMSNIVNQRNDYLHKISTQLVNEYDVIVVEDLKVKNMTKNHYLARSILRQSWSKFSKMLEYKCQRAGKTFLKVAPAYTSRICSNCGKDTGKKDLSVREWDCPFCHVHHDRDINAAINILNKGLKQLETA